MTAGATERDLGVDVVLVVSEEVICRGAVGVERSVTRVDPFDEGDVAGESVGGAVMGERE